jgi:hypothetical protein
MASKLSFIRPSERISCYFQLYEAKLRAEPLGR